MHPMLLTVAESEAELTDTPEGDHLKSNRPKERRVSRTYTAHKALLEASVLRSIKDWNLPRDEGTENVGQHTNDRCFSLPVQPEQPEQPELHTSDKFMRPDISKTENRMYAHL